MSGASAREARSREIARAYPRADGRVGAKLMVGTHGSSASELMAALAAHGGGAVWLCHGRKRGECSDRWEELGA